MSPRLHRNRKRPQRGVMLIEVLVALLIFAIGLLSIVGLHANAVSQSGDSRYRTEATMLASELIGQMWLTDRSFTAINTGYATGGAQFNDWLARVEALLPNSSTSTVAVTSVSGVTNVVVTVRWRGPTEPTTAALHKVEFVTQIK